MEFLSTNKNRKLTDAQESLLCERYLANEKITVLLAEFLINESTLGSIRKRRGIPTRKKVLIPVNENFFEIINTPVKAYWLGFFSGDGAHHNYPDGKFCHITIKLKSSDSGHLFKFANDTEAKQNIKIWNRFDSRNGGKYYGSCSIHICRPKMGKDLENLGVGKNKSKELHIPNIFKELLKYYFRGIIDADGGWHIRKKQMQFHFASSCYCYMLEFRDFFAKECGMNSEIWIQPKKNKLGEVTNYSIKYGGNLNCKILYEYLYDDIGPVLDRKFEYCKKFFDWYNEQIQAYSNNYTLEGECFKRITKLNSDVTNTNNNLRNRKGIKIFNFIDPITNKLESWIENPNWNGKFLDILIKID